MILYHGINKKDINSIVEEGLNSSSYWGTLEEALKYTNCSSVISIDTDYCDLSILPNYTIIEHYRDQDHELYTEWVMSKQTWQDSIKLFGSVIIEERINVDYEDIKNMN